MSSKLPENNFQTITNFLYFQNSMLAEDTSEDSSKFAFDDPLIFFVYTKNLSCRPKSLSASSKS